MRCETGCALNSLCLKGELRTEYLMEASKLKRKVDHLSFRRQGNIWTQNDSLILGCLHASCFFYIMLKWTVGMAFGGSEQISFYWLLNWPSRGTNRRETEQWRKKKGRLKILKRVNISFWWRKAWFTWYLWGVHRQIFLNAKKHLYWNKVDPYPWRNYFFLSAEIGYVKG